ncbi:MAG: hypothetical protein AAFX09_03835 [Pseudomonadota bacterium]
MKPSPFAVSRRSLMLMTAAGAALGACSAPSGEPRSPAATPTSASEHLNDPFHRDALQADLAAYDGFGVHRTGSAADLATADWLEARFQAHGFSTERQAFTAPDHDAIEARIIFGEDALGLIAQPPFRRDGENRVSAPLVYAGPAGPDGPLAGAIVVADTPHARHSESLGWAVRPIVEQCLAQGAAALIIVTNGPSRDAAVLNINLDNTYPLMAIAAPGEAAGLIAAAREGLDAQLDTPPQRPAREAVNVIGRIARPGRPHIVVSTPYSGWTHCAGERGPGVAAMLAFAAWLPAATTDHSITLFCASGHELDAYGGRLWLADGAPPPQDTALWVHLGAGWAARDWHETPRRLLPMQSSDAQRYLMASAPVLETVRTAFADIPGLAQTYPLTVETAAGELKHIAEYGYQPAIGAFAAHRLHHVMSDRMNAVSGALVEPPSRAFQKAVAQVLGL